MVRRVEASNKRRDCREKRVYCWVSMILLPMVFRIRDQGKGLVRTTRAPGLLYGSTQKVRLTKSICPPGEKSAETT